MVRTTTPAPTSDTTQTDAVAALLASLWEHRDDLTTIAAELPVVLRDTGEQLRLAGERAQLASTHLAGDVRDFAGHAADMLEASKHQLLSVLSSLEKAGGMLKNLPFIGEMGKMMGDQLGPIADVAHSLDQVGQKVRGLGDKLSDVGDDLALMGTSLLDGGDRLANFGLPPEQRTTSKRAPKKPVKKSAAKKKPTAAAKKKGTGKPVKKTGSK